MEKRRKNSLYSLEERDAIVNEYNQSDLSPQQFCEHRGIKFSTFKNWKYSKLITRESTHSSFIEVNIKEQSKIAACSQTVMKITHPNGVIIEIPSIIERKGLSNLLELLGMKL